MYVNNDKLADADAVLRHEQLLHGRHVLLRRGRKTLAAVHVL